MSDCSVKLDYFSFCDRSCANDTYGFGVPGSQVSELPIVSKDYCSNLDS